MRVLVGCEESQEITKAFRALGHIAYSCDLKPCSGGHPEWHIQGDVIKEIYALWTPNRAWDLFIASPPCTDIAASGARHFPEKIADGRQGRAKEFFMRLAWAPCDKICIENPVGIMSTQYRKPDQYIQPYQFGHDASKKTCLWLRGLEPLKLDPKQYVPPRTVNGKPRWGNQTDSGQNILSPSEHRAEDRAKTYAGIARAMALQWGGEAPQ